RGRRGGGGGMREGVGQAQGSPVPEADAPYTNGGHDAPSGSAAPPPPPERSPVPDQPLAREYHAEPRELPAAHEPAPIAHFEPTPKPDPGAPPNKPYVVWSSAPEPDAGPRGSEE
ncbi:MAG: hypothetical protein ACRETG_06040, partial [Steroidobacteraceae bacterium]